MAGFNLPIQAIPPQLLAEMARAAFKPPALMSGGGGGGGGGGMQMPQSQGFDVQGASNGALALGGLGAGLFKDKPPTVDELNEILNKGQKLAPSNASYGDLGGPGGTYESPGWFARNFGGGLADGGPVMPGKYYTVGERGPETFVPAVPGYIVPDAGGRYADYPGLPSGGNYADYPGLPSGNYADYPSLPSGGRYVDDPYSAVRPSERDFFGGRRRR